jgi:trigger factor
MNPELTREISVEAPAEDVTKAFRKVTKQYQKLARIPGFRPGKVPESLIQSKFAKDVRQEVMESLVSERFRLALEEQKLQPISQPQITELNLFDGQPLRFRASFEILPQIDVTGYETLKADKADASVSDEEYQNELDYLIDQHSTVETVEEDRPLVDGDWAEIQFKGTVKDLAQTVGEEGLQSASTEEPITGDDVLVEINGKNTLPAFTEALRGSKVGQELTAEVVYPADFGEARLAGKTVEYDVTVKAIKKKTPPEQSVEFVQQLGNYESWDDFTTKFRENVEGRKKTSLENSAKEKLVDELVAKYQFPVPESFVQQQIDARLDRGLRALAQQGMPPEEMRKLDFARLREAQRDEAVNEVKASMILDKIADAENVEISDSDLDRELFILSIQSREPIEQLRERLTKDGSLQRLREQMRREKTGTALYEKLSA